MATPPKKRPLFADKPREINVVDFVKERAAEISDLLAVIDNHSLPAGEVCHGPRTFIQRMPRHLRRRAMSHNIKRLPRQIRAFSDIFAKETTHRKKPPSRYHRRRPGNLLQAYARRQRKNHWLETHIWHAKRFHMSDYWGHRVAERSCARGFRASYRDAKNHCLIQDLSYWSCIQLDGPADILLKQLGQCCSQSLGLTFRFKPAHNGGLEVSVILYRPNQYPYGCIGPVRFCWKKCDTESYTTMESSSPEAQDHKLRTLWIWTHPGIHGEVLDVFKQLFQLESVEVGRENEEDIDKCGDFKSLMEVQLAKIEDANCLRRSKKFTQVSLTELKDQLVRFRLTGPKSTQILKSICHFPDLLRSADLRNEGSESTLIGNKRWWHEYLAENGKSVEKQKENWDMIAISRPGNLPTNGQIFSLLLRDLRLHRSQKKEIPDGKGKSPHQKLAMIDFEYAESPIWNGNVREACLAEKPSDFSLHQIRSKQPFPGLPTVENEQCVAAVPVLAIARTSTNCVLSGRKGRLSRSVTSSGLGEGWDLVIPGGWAMPFWIAAQYATARAGGLRESRSIALESGYFSFPNDWPDTSAGMETESKEEKELKDKHERRPWNRRVRFGERGMKYPFKFPLSELIDGWLGKMADPSFRDESPAPDGIRDTFFVLRHKSELRKLAIWVASGGDYASAGISESFFSQNSRALIPVRMESNGKGRPIRRSLICLPNVEDFSKLEDKKSNGNLMSEMTPSARKVDGLNDDKINEDSSEERLWPEDDFVSLRHETEVDLSEMFSDKEIEKIIAQKEKMREKKKKRIPNPVKVNDKEIHENIVNSCSRKILGFMVQGDTSFSVGKGVGMGYCSLLGLRNLVENFSVQKKLRNILLFRNMTSRAYRAGRLEIVTANCV